MFESYSYLIVMIALGFGYAGLVASVWPLIPFTVTENHVGLAYGITTALQNLGLTVVPLLVRNTSMCTNFFLARMGKNGIRLVQPDTMDIPCSFSINPPQ